MVHVPKPVAHAEFHARCSACFCDPAFEVERAAFGRLEAIVKIVISDYGLSMQTCKDCVFTPASWCQWLSLARLMIDRLACADCGNPDPTITHGELVSEAKLIEPNGCDFPKHLAEWADGVVLHEAMTADVTNHPIGTLPELQANGFSCEL